MKEVSKLSIIYNLTGEQRKALVKAISEILGQPSVYKGAPQFEYAVGGLIIDRNGSVTYPIGTTANSINNLVSGLRARGFAPEEAPEHAVSWDYQRLSVEVPREGFSDMALENLRKIEECFRHILTLPLSCNSRFLQK